MACLHELSRSAGLCLLTFLFLFAGTCRVDGEPPPQPSLRAGKRFEVPVALRVQEARFDPCASAAVFIGFRKFAGFAEVPYAVDDAVDLAHLFALELGLVCAQKVLILRSGRPAKEASRDRMHDLEEAGAEIRLLRQRDVEAAKRNLIGRELLAAMTAHLASVEANGVLILAVASHGVSKDREHYLMTPSSVLGDPVASGVALREILSLVDRSRAGGSLLFVDACRGPAGDRGGGGSARPASSVMSPLPVDIAPDGQAIFLAAAEGCYAYDDTERRNGVFSGAVIDALHCAAPADSRGHITPQVIATFANTAVASWTKVNKLPNCGIEWRFSAGVERMALAACDPLAGLPEPVLGEILQPSTGDIEGPTGKVVARVYVAGYYAVALIRPLSAGNRWWVQNNPQLAFRDREITIPVHYGGNDQFEIMIGLTRDPTFFAHRPKLSHLPLIDHDGKQIHWLDPVVVEAIHPLQ